MTEVKWLETSYMHPDEVAPEHWARIMMTREAYAAMVQERSERDKKAPTVGQLAPDFVAEHLTLSGRRTGQFFQLSKSLGKPVALVFGSYT